MSNFRAILKAIRFMIFEANISLNQVHTVEAASSNSNADLVLHFGKLYHTDAG